MLLPAVLALAAHGTSRANAATDGEARCSFCTESPVVVGNLRIEKNPLLVVDANGATSGVVRACNATGQAIDVELTTSDFEGYAADGTSYPLAASPTLTIAGNPATQTKQLAAAQCVDVRLDVAGLWQAGLLTATLRNRGEPVVPLKAVRYQVPFSLRVLGSTPPKAEVAIVRGRKSRIVLQNDDPMAYRVRWVLTIGEFVLPGKGWIEPKRDLAIDFVFDRSRFSFLESGFLRTGTRAGSLVVNYEPDAAFRVFPLPQQRFDVEARMEYWGGSAQKIWNYMFILAMLVVGIVASLLINYTLPTQNKRVALKQRLADLEGRLAGLAKAVDPQKLHRLRVEKKRMRNELRELWPIFPSSDAALDELTERIRFLEKRIELTAAAGAHMAAVRRDDWLTPEEEDEVEDACAKVLTLAEKPSHTAKELEAAEDELRVAEQIRASCATAPSDEMRGALEKLRGSAIDALHFRDVDAQLWRPFDSLRGDLRAALKAPIPAQLARADYVRLARTVRKAELLGRFVALLAADGGEARTARLARVEDLLGALSPGADESLEQARIILAESRQAVGRQEIEDEIQNGNARIEVDPPRPFLYGLVTLRVVCDRPGLDAAVARNEIECKWSIDDDALDGPGLTVCAYFPQEPWTVRVAKWVKRVRRRPRKEWAFRSVKARVGTNPPYLLTKEVEVDEVKSYVESRTFLALAALVITILAVGISMLAGAVEKLQTFDWVTGVVAIVILGFGADVLKRLITRPSTPDDGTARRTS